MLGLLVGLCVCMLCVPGAWSVCVCMLCVPGACVCLLCVTDAWSVSAFAVVPAVASESLSVSCLDGVAPVCASS